MITASLKIYGLSIKFLLYKSDKFFSGGQFNWLSGYGDVYKKLFTNTHIKNLGGQNCRRSDYKVTKIQVIFQNRGIFRWDEQSTLSAEIDLIARYISTSNKR